MNDTHDMLATGDGRGELFRLLDQRGWHFDATVPNNRGHEKSVVAYQEWWGLKPDGWPGPITERSLRTPRFCGRPDREHVRGEIGKFSPAVADQIRWAIHSHPRGTVVTALQVNDVFQQAWQAWASVCGIKASNTAPDSVAHVRINFDRIDRSGGTLAWSELAPLTGRSHLRQRYDIAEPWGYGATRPTDNRRIWLLIVAIHEIGHALGIDHLPGNTGDVMNPIYNPNLDGLQDGDIAEAVRRYGPPLRPPLPPPSSDEKIATVVIGDDEWQGRLRKVT